MKRLRQKKGQSTVEYVIVFTAIAVAIIFAASTIITPAVNKTYTQAGAKIGAAANFFGERAGFGMMNTN